MPRILTATVSPTTAANLPPNATFNPATRTFAWTPTSTQVGTVTVNFAVSDGSLSDTEAVGITVTAVNRAPVLTPIGSKTIGAGSPLTFTVSATDPDGNSLTYTAANLPANATFNPANRTFAWTPTSAQVGTVTVTFAVSDGSLSDTEPVGITVTEASITVISPNGGESWKRGTTQTISWDYKGGVGSTVKIVLLKAGIAVGTITTSTSIGNNGKGSYNWLISTTDMTGGDFNVLVQSINQPAIKDMSNRYFKIRSKMPVGD